MPTDSDPETLLDAAWAVRRQRWARRLGRLRLGVEPLGAQLARHRRVTWALTIVPGLIATMFVALFAAFGRPDVGLVLSAVLLGPIVVFAWLDYARLRRRASAYEGELRTYEAKKAGPFS